MDRNLHTDDFERLLREKSDEFRMYPSKRVWYSVYNNIHPGRKWPSVVMSMVLITSLLLVGYLNTSEPNRSAGVNKSIASTPRSLINNEGAPLDYIFQPFVAYQPITSLTTGVEKSAGGDIAHTPAQASKDLASNLVKSGPFSKSHGAEKSLQDQPQNTTGKIDEHANEVMIAGTGELSGVLKIEPVELRNDVLFETGIVQDEQREKSLSRLVTAGLTARSAGGINANPEGLTNEKVAFASSKKEKKPGVPAKPYILTPEEKEWVDNYAMYNRPQPKKWAGKLAGQVYFTPSVVYRQLQNDPNFGATSNSAPFVIPVDNQDINKQVIQKPSIGLEVGAGIQYPIFKRLRLKTGLQLNFTRYNSHAYHNAHPVATKLTMHDYTTNSTYELFRTTSYSNKTGLSAVKLHNETYQVSLPIGVDFRLLGNEGIQWNVGVTIQPTYVVGGKSYLISSDRRNYVRETTMLNKWNMNASFETFLSYKANGLTYQIGPQFRSQLFSTNTKEFAVEERLLTYGIKFGIMKTLK